MRREVRFAGFGGQGVIKAAILLSLAAGLGEDKEIAQTQSYGPEARGGACRSEVVISDAAIDYLKPLKIDYFVVMSQPALNQYLADLDLEETAIIYDSTLVKDLPPAARRLFPVPATETAEKEFGQALFANILMLGALSAVSGLVSLESLEKTLPGQVPVKTLEKNLQALRRGAALVNVGAMAS